MQLLKMMRNTKKIIQLVEAGCKRGEMRRKVDKDHPAFALSYIWDTLRIVCDDKNRAIIFVEDQVFVFTQF